MSAHLTNEELTDNLLGVTSVTVNAHLLSCPACANELDRLKSSIAGFRSAAHAWSEGALAEDRAVQVVRTLPKRSWSPANWVLATVALILLAAGFAFYVRDYQARTQISVAPVVTTKATFETPESQIAADNELLSQVNSELAEAVPAPMQPLRLLEPAASSTSATE
jgi:anti-sigma factor RsiW